MRGPGLRATLDVRRHWRCPVCGVDRRVSQSETSARCRCCEPAVQMALVEDQPRRRPSPRPVAKFIEEAELPPEDDPSAVPALVSPDGVPPSAAHSAAADAPADAVPPLGEPLPDAPAPAKRRRRRSKGGHRGLPPVETASDVTAAHDAPQSLSEPPPAVSPSTAAPTDTPADDFGAGLTDHA